MSYKCDRCDKDFTKGFRSSAGLTICAPCVGILVNLGLAIETLRRGSTDKPFRHEEMTDWDLLPDA